MALPKAKSTHTPTFHKNPSYLKLNFSKQESVEQARKDWFRGIGTKTILINGSDCLSSLKDFPFKVEETPVGNINLAKLWNDLIIQKLEIPPQAGYNLLQHLGQHAHQFGYLHALKTSMSNAIGNTGYLLDGSQKQSPSIMNFIINAKNKKLIIEESVKINKIVSFDDPLNDNKAIIAKKNGPLLCTGILRHEISFNKNNEVQHKVASIDIQYNDAKVSKLIVKRTVVQMIKDFFKNLMYVPALPTKPSRGRIK